MNIFIGQIRKSTKTDRYYIILSINQTVGRQGLPDAYIFNVWDSNGWTDKESSSYLDKWTMPVA